MAALVIVVAAVVIGALTSGGDGDSPKSQQSALTTTIVLDVDNRAPATTRHLHRRRRLAGAPGGIDQLTSRGAKP